MSGRHLGSASRGLLVEKRFADAWSRRVRCRTPRHGSNMLPPRLERLQGLVTGEEASGAQECSH